MGLVKRPILILGVIFVLIGSLITIRDYNSRVAVSCAVEPVIPTVDVKVLNVTNGNIVRGFILAFRAPLESPNVTVLDPETGRSPVYRKEGALYVPVEPPLPLRLFRVEGLGNTTVEVYWQSPYTTVVLDTPSFKPVPGGFKYVTTTDYPFWLGFYAEIENPRGVIRIPDNGSTGIVLNDDSVNLTILNRTVEGVPKFLKILYPREGPFVLHLEGSVEVNGTEKNYSYEFPTRNTTWIRIEKGFKFTSMRLYSRYPFGNETEKCTTTHQVGLEGPLSLSLGLLMIFAGLLWRT
ncbi:hypothetical protein [Thermococcus sp. 21S7]|uniref:hypothetical protein n=1 Tax=Thermococcus sp. 21S7 TaxID=1638221 RepID=UPI00143A9AF0|nr:hypothetical protein [Thermococcus sp. 21S7]NJE60231.1 hypothetical protein [Thermococcus sp. 21S7]